MAVDDNKVNVALFVSDCIYYYLRQVNEVNGGDNVFVRCGSVCLSVCAQHSVMFLMRHLVSTICSSHRNAHRT